jgi:hypothetical protein
MQPRAIERVLRERLRDYPTIVLRLDNIQWLELVRGNEQVIPR